MVTPWSIYHPRMFIKVTYQENPIDKKADTVTIIAFVFENGTRFWSGVDT